MSSNFQKFLEGFIDEETNKDNDNKKEDQNIKQNKVEKPVKEMQIAKVEYKSITKEEKSIDNTDNNSKNDINNNQKSKPKLKLNLLKKNKPKEKEILLNNNNQSNQLKVSQQQVNNIELNKPNIDEQKIKERSEQLELEELFRKSYTPLEHKEKWMATIKKARQSDMKTMLNRKVRTGKFRFNYIGELEILPDLDTSGKSSKEILSIKWDKEEM